MKIGTLVKIIAKEQFNNHVVGWFKTSTGIKLHLFDEPVVYGMFLDDSIISNDVFWYQVLVKDRIFLFTLKQLREVENK